METWLCLVQTARYVYGVTARVFSSRLVLWDDITSEVGLRVGSVPNQEQANAPRSSSDLGPGMTEELVVPIGAACQAGIRGTLAVGMIGRQPAVAIVIVDTVISQLPEHQN